MATYSTPADMILGSLATPDSAKTTKYVQDAADEIDSILGMRYVTPIVIDANVPANRASSLLLKRINNWLASGMWILATSAPQEDVQLNAYGSKLVNDARSALNQLAIGDITLTGAAFLDVTDVGQSGPILNNLDATSQVEAFYAYVSTPYNPYALPWNEPGLFPSGDGTGSYVGPN